MHDIYYGDIETCKYCGCEYDPEKSNATVIADYCCSDCEIDAHSDEFL